MKKTLLCMALFGATIGAAQAQSTVSISGRLDMSYGSLHTAAGTTQLLNTDTWTSARFTFAGVEDLGGGMKAGFFLESKMPADTGVFTGFNRESYVYLKNNFGQLSAGEILLWATEADNYTNTSGSNQVRPFGTLRPIGDKVPNTLAYTSPNLSGLAVQLAHTFGETVAASTGNQDSIAARYGIGNLKATASFGKKVVTPGKDLKQSIASIGYNFGVVAVAGGYLVKDNTDTTVNDKTKLYWLNANLPIGSGALMASYQKQKNDQGAAYDGHGWVVGGKYNFSKRTAVYTTYATATNNASGTFAVTSLTASGGRTNSITSLGLIHMF
ncbi:MAG: porin [Burkholderiaceae bacterium]|nr:MAG: porin [Burkholderiaceae bacterium]